MKNKKYITLFKVGVAMFLICFPLNFVMMFLPNDIIESFVKIDFIITPILAFSGMALIFISSILRVKAAKEEQQQKENSNNTYAGPIGNAYFSKIECPHCGTMNPKSNRYCLNCGNNLKNEYEGIEIEKICPKCGCINREKATKCEECGTKL